MGNPVTQNIVFSLGTVGGGKFKASMVAAAAAIGVVGAKLNAVRKDAEVFANRWNALSEGMRAAAMEMDAAGKGLVDTGQALKTVIDLEKAGVDATGKLTSAIGRLATVEGQKLGETYDQINQRVDQLTDAISKGQQRALKEYGISIKTSVHLHETQDAAMAAVIERAEGLEVQWRNLSDALSAMENDYDTMIGLLWSSVGKVTGVTNAFDKTHKGLSHFNSLLSQSPDAVMYWVRSFNPMTTVLAAITGDTRKLTSEILRLNRIMAQQKQLEGYRESKAISESIIDDLADADDAAEFSAMEASYGFDEDASYNTQKTGDPVGAAKESAYWAKKNKHSLSGGGGGGGKKKKGSTGFSGLNITETQIVEVPIQPTVLIVDPDAWEAEVTGLTRDPLAAAHAEQEMDYMVHRERMEQIHQVSQMETMLGIDQAYVDASYDMWNSSLRGRAMLLEGFFASGSQLMQAYNKESETSNRALFGYAKAMAYGQAVMKTAEAAISAYSSMVGIPYVGPVLGVIAAANAIAMGAAQIATIKATKYGGGSSGGASKSVSSGGGASTSVSAMSAGGGMGGGGSGGGDTYYVVQGGLWASDDAADSIKAKFNENTATGRWAHGWKESA